MVVPHCGSKTINVRLTVSPDSKSKSAGDSVKKSSAKKPQRLKSRRLFKCDDDEEGSGSGCIDANPMETTKTSAATATAAAQHLIDDSMHQQPATVLENQSTSIAGCDNKINGIVTNEKHANELTVRQSKDTVDGRLAPCCLTDTTAKVTRQSKTNQTTENIYESAPIVTAHDPINGQATKIKCDKITLNNNHACCQDCRLTSVPYHVDGGVHISKPCARRLGRKSRSRKTKTHDSHPAARIRSLSVGNENSYRNSNGDASSGASGKDRNDECLNNLRRNDLIDIIRESMEKSRLCFQSNG